MELVGYVALTNPTVQKTGAEAVVLMQVAWGKTEELWISYVGRELWLRHRARNGVQQLEGEMERLQSIERQAKSAVQRLEKQVQGLQSQQAALRTTIHTFAAAVQRSDGHYEIEYEVAGKTIKATEFEALIRQKALEFAAQQKEWQERQDALNVNQEVAERAHAWQPVASQQRDNLVATLALFEMTIQLAQPGSPTATAAEETLQALNEQLQSQLAQAAQLSAARQSLEQIQS